MNKKIVINLRGPEGNAFSLLSVAKDLTHINNFDWDNIYNEMTKSDYENLIQVMDNYFGDQITLQR
jgi:hypothetical protein